MDITWINVLITLFKNIYHKCFLWYIYTYKNNIIFLIVKLKIIPGIYKYFVLEISFLDFISNFRCGKKNNQRISKTIYCEMCGLPLLMKIDEINIYDRFLIYEAKIL